MVESVDKGLAQACLSKVEGGIDFLWQLCAARFWLQ